ncbi:MAG: hypothetical protein WCO68_00005 [Verrucomicrobiota bacterium]
MPSDLAGNRLGAFYVGDTVPIIYNDDALNRFVRIDEKLRTGSWLHATNMLRPASSAKNDLLLSIIRLAPFFLLVDTVIHDDGGQETKWEIPINL